MSNPFNTTFGELPHSFIEREKEENIVWDAFKGEIPETKGYIITGPRGSGKTVLLTKLKRRFKDNGYLTVDLNSYMDTEEQLAAKLYEEGRLWKLFLTPDFSFSFHGITFSIDGANKISNVTTLLEKMFNYLKKKGKRVLVTIDDVSDSEEMRKFVFLFQQFIREGYPIFLLMTGLYENISELGKNKSLTFFVRAPKIILDPLSLAAIAFSYNRFLGTSERESANYAKLTKGYAYGYQTLGYLLFKAGNRKIDLGEYDLKLYDNSYSLIWEKLTKKERDILKEIGNVSRQVDLCKRLNMSNGALQIYKKRLLDKGLIVAKTRGSIDYALPRFKEFINLRTILEDDD